MAAERDDGQPFGCPLQVFELSAEFNMISEWQNELVFDPALDLFHEPTDVAARDVALHYNASFLPLTRDG